MSEHSQHRPLIVGIGNEFRSDDGVGPWVAKALAECGCHAQTHYFDGTGLIDLFTEYGNIILVDATRSNAPAGTCLHLDAVIEPLPAGLFHYSTHRFGLAEAVETARALGELPQALSVYGIEGACFDAGVGLTPAVEQAASALVSQLAKKTEPG